MRIISKTALVNFWEIHTEAQDRLNAWYRAIKNCTAYDFNELRQSFQTADYVPKKFTIFDVGGNIYRIVTVIHYDKQIVYIRGVFTHPEYDKWTKGNRSK